MSRHAPCLPGLFSPLDEPRRKETPVVKEITRRSKNAQKVLERLQRGPATTMELIAVGGARAVGRCWELRQAGYDIAVEHIDGGLYRYTLKQ